MSRTGRLFGFDEPCPKCGQLKGEHLLNGDCPTRRVEKGAYRMTDIDVLLNRLLVAAQEMDGLPPYDRKPLDISLGELTLLSKGLGLLAAVRSAIK